MPQQVSSTEAFAFEVRVLSCANCGAPVQSGTGGGSTSCSYCNVTNHIIARDNRAAEADAALPAKITEAERYAKLRSQVGSARPAPPALQHILLKGNLGADHLEAAQKEWRRARGECAHGSDAFGPCERLYFLTVAISEHLRRPEERTALRGMVEAALDHLEDQHHRQVLHSLLAREAARDGELDAAERWLSLSNPRSDDLHADTAFRLATALIATQQGEFQKVTLVLGSGAYDVPIADEHNDFCMFLRANAIERAGQDAIAIKQLLPLLLMSKRPDHLKRELVDKAGIELCRTSYPMALTQSKQLMAATVSTFSVVVLALAPILLALVAYVMIRLLLPVVGYVNIAQPVAVAVSTGLMATILVSYWVRSRWATRCGVSASAVVLRAVSTGLQDEDGTAHIKLLLFVEPPDGSPYTVWFRQTGMRSTETPGNRIKVVVHPTDRRRLRVP